MLCPVCNERPLTGRQSTCGTKCRSARYRKRKQQRDASQQDAAGATSVRVSNQRRRNSDAKSWERLVNAAADRIIEAVQQQGSSAVAPSRDSWRVDLRQQVTSQAPALAVGYRLVLPGRCDNDAPKFSPKRSRASGVAWYLLTPFEYPDDIRLRDGCWYRIVWVNTQGQRIRQQPGEPVPGLYYFLGPSLGSQDSTSRRGERLHGAENESATHKPPEVTPVAAGPAQSPPAQNAAAPPSVPAAASPVSPGPLDDDIAEEFVDKIVRQINLDLTKSSDQRFGEALKKAFDSAPFGVSAPPPENWTQLLASFPPLTPEESWMQANFVVHPALMLQIHYEEQLAEAKASGRPPPKEPITLISQEERQHLHSLFTGQIMRPHFWSRCKAIFEYVRQHGVEVLAYLPVPIPPLPPTEKRFIETVVANPAKRTYMSYVCARQDAQLSGQPLPAEPNVPISSKERNQIRRAMQDLRAVVFFKRSVVSAGA